MVELLISGGMGTNLCQRLKEAGVPACLVISTPTRATRRSQRARFPAEAARSAAVRLDWPRLAREERLLQGATSDERASPERPFPPRRPTRRRPGGRNQHVHRASGNRQDDPRSAIPVRERATLERPALYLATVSEPFDKILCYGQGLFSSTRCAGRSSSPTRTSAWRSTSAASPASWR